MLYHYVTQMLAQAFISVRDVGKVNKIRSLSPVSDYISPHFFPLNSQRLEIFKISLHFKTYINSCCLCLVNQSVKFIPFTTLFPYTETHTSLPQTIS